MKFRRWMSVAVLGLALVVGTSPAMAEKKELDHFFKKPEYAGFQLSPDGSTLAGMVPVENRMNIAVIDLETMKASVVTNERDQDVSGFTWANDERLLFYMDADGSESFGIFAINIDGSKYRMLVEPIALQIANSARVIRITSLLDVLEDDKDHVLVQNNDKRASYPDVYRMNINNGRKRLQISNPGNVVGWFTDWDGKVIGGAYQEGTESGWLRYDEDTEEYTEVTRARYDEHSYTPAGFSGDGVNGWVSSNVTPDGEPRDKAGIYEYNFETNEFGKLIYENDTVDMSGVMMSSKTKDMIGVAYMIGKPEYVYTDEKWAKMMAGINQALPDSVNVISSVDDDEKIGIVAASSDVKPTTYYIYDFEERKLEYLASSRPWVNPEEMSPMKPVSFTARDGRTLHGYLTVPVGTDGENLPLVVNPHGGPWARDSWGFNPEHQFMANRGYAVLQVNFRGSTGFGMDHMMSSRKQWGQAMQNDVTDAVMWAIEEGVADKDKVCIYGASYGGYATMAGLTFTPELYQCGINYVGVTDLPLLFKTAPDAWGSGIEQMYELVGHYKEEREFLEQWSPSNHADKIQAPVFMAYGKQDPRVAIDHAEVMEDALKEHGKDYELMVKDDEGHGFRKQENVYDFYGRVDSFLAENLNP